MERRNAVQFASLALGGAALAATGAEFFRIDARELTRSPVGSMKDISHPCKPSGHVHVQCGCRRRLF